jgi:hypothetical protein
MKGEQEEKKGLTYRAANALWCCRVHGPREVAGEVRKNRGGRFCSLEWVACDWLASVHRVQAHQSMLPGYNIGSRV